MNEPDTLDEDKEREADYIPPTELKAAGLAATAHRHNATDSSSLTGVIEAILAVERRVYWHGLVMQQRS